MLMSSERPATLQYLPNSFRVLAPGGYVVCAVTGEHIPLDALRYWNADRQEPYANPEAATRRLTGQV